MGSCKGKFLLMCVVLQFAFLCVTNAQQYYDPKYRRYVFVGDEPEKIKNIRNNINNRQAVYVSNQQELARMQAENLQAQENVEKQKDGVQAYRKFDPNRYHNTEEIDFL